jgi:hypothetical protein
LTDFVDLYSRDYCGTFVGVKIDSIMYPFRVEGVDSYTDSYDEEACYLTGNIYRESGLSSLHINVFDTNLDLNHVDLGMIQVASGVGYVKRMPRRQWRRGFRMNNCARTASFVASFRTESHQFYRAVFNPTYKTLDEALRSIRRANSLSNTGYALTQDFALVRNTSHCSLPMIQYKDRLLGYIDNDGDLHLQEEMDTPMIRKMLSIIYTKGVIKHASIRNRR